MMTIVVLLAFLMSAVAKTPDTCPKPPTSLLCNVGVKNICTNATNCVAGTLCCSDGCRKRCRDPSENNRGFEEAIPRGGTCPPNLKPPSGDCASDSDECMFDWDCEQGTKKCCSNNCFKECVEPSLSAALRGKCPAPKEFAECHMGYRDLCSNDSECNHIVGGVCCFDGCRRRCATVDKFQDALKTERLGRCPDLPDPEFCAGDVNECEFDADCYPGRKCCRNTCFKRCLDPLHETGNMNVTQGAATGQCPTVSSSSKRCHIGLAHVCNNDNDCINSSCCFDGCRRKCLDPSGKSAGAQGELKKGTCPFLPPPQVCASDVDECFIDWDCVGDRKCCSNGCYKICAPPSKDRSAVGQVQAEAAVQCPEPVASSCTFSMKHACDYSSECFTGKICCFDGCRRRCVPPKGTSGVCPKPPETLGCPVGLRNMCVDDASCVNGTLCCSDGCRRRCKDRSLFGAGIEDGKPRPGTCPSVLPPSGKCVSHYDECRYDWDCEGTTKKCCSNTCYNVCVEPAVGVVQDNCPAPTKRLRCHIGLRAQCSSKSDCTHVSGGLCCFDGCRRRCATARGFEARLETPRPGKCPILQPPEFRCVGDYDECEFDGDCYPGKKCCSNTCFTRCVNPTFGDVGSVSADPTTKCPITTPSKKCHVGYKNTCNNDDECETGTLCCFTGCRRLCWDPELRSSSRINKTGSCPALPPVTGPCASDVDECFMDSDCVKDKKCCSNGCFTICVPPAKTSITPAAAVKCPVPVPYPCTSSMRPSCEDQKDCSDDKVCCFDGCRPICVSPKGAPLRTKGVTITCRKNEMQIDVERNVLSGFQSSYLRLNNRSCRAQGNETHFSLVAPLMSCGTVSSHTDEAVVYSNSVEEVQVEYEGSITRMPELTIPFSCYYTKEGVTSTYGIIPRKLKMKMDGGDTTTEFTLEISVFKDQNYSFPYGIRDFPLKVTLNKPLFVQLAMDSPDTRLELREERCYATPTQNPDDDMKYYIIRQSCPVDSTVTHYSAPRDVRRFSFDTFQFSGDYGSFVYLHCNLVVCNASKPNSRCSVDCASLQFPRKRRDIEDNKDEVTAGLTEGPFILRREPDEEWRYAYTKKDSPLNVNTVIVIAMAVFCAMCLGIIVYMKVKAAPKPKPDPERETYL